MAEHIPWAKRFSDEVDSFFDLWKNRRWLAVLFVIIVAGVCIFTSIGWFQRGKKIDTLTSDNKDLKRDIRQLESENKGLRETVAPLLARAAKEFPGEEINISLKKIINRLEKQLPARQPIASATATVILQINSDADVNAHYMDSGGYVALGQGNSALLQASSHESWGNQLGNSTVRYRGVFTMPADSNAVGKPIEFLGQAQFIQLEFKQMPDNSVVTDGKVILVINDSVRLEFLIPQQQSNEKRVFIRNLSEGLKPLASNNTINPTGR